MGWKTIAHRWSGHRWHFCRHYTMGKAEVRMEMWTACDGSGEVEHIELYKFGDLIDESHGDHGENVAKINEWIDQHAP